MVEYQVIYAEGRWMPSNYGKRLCESTGTRDLSEAQALLALRVTQARRVHFYGEQREHTFKEAVDKFLAENGHKRSLERDRRALEMLDPYIGRLPLRSVHHDTLTPFVRSRLAVAPLILMQRHPHRREPYPLSVPEQRLLFSELQTHLASMALFKVNAGPL